MQVYNMDLAGLIRRLRRFRFETVKCVSANLAAVSAADFNRLKSYLQAIETYLNWVVAQPQLDLPEMSPKLIDLGEPEVITPPENEALMDLVNLWDAFEVEMGHSQSARMTTGIISHDEKRARDLIAKMGNFLDQYIAQILPLDLPESSPNLPMTGPGRPGVNPLT